MFCFIIFQIKVELPDKKPPSAADMKGKLKLKCKYYCPYRRHGEEEEEGEEHCSDRESRIYEIDMADYPSGLIQFTLPEPIEEKFQSLEMTVNII